MAGNCATSGAAPSRLCFCHCSALMYLKFICIWGAIMAADYLLEFRFEYLWPFWLVLRSVYDSFKYQGLVGGAPSGGMRDVDLFV